MSITQLFIVAVIAILVGRLKRGRSLALLAASTFAIYWLQPVQSPANLTFWFPTFTLLIVVFSWWVAFSSKQADWRRDTPALLVLAGVMILMGLNRYFQLEQVFITETPRLMLIGVTAALLVSPALPFIRLAGAGAGRYLVLIAILLGLLIITRLPSVTMGLYGALLSLRGKEASSFDPAPFLWLGFSYVVFRLLHTIFDKIAGRLAPMALGDYINYVIFFPSFVAGPIDRYERFASDLHEPVTLDNPGWLEAGRRFFSGLFKKFVLADGLAWIALNPTFLMDTESSPWLWFFLYIYSLRIYLDFSGYTEMAIGLGRFLGVRLPENFNAPYLKPNLTMFWNSWHMTLTQWFRAYFFNPLTRSLRSSAWNLPTVLVMLIIQMATMILIGLWHGITANFLLWGVWHGVGLFVQNR